MTISVFIEWGLELTLPAFTIDGILPPYIGPRGPGDHHDLMTPYKVSAADVVRQLGSTGRRCDLLTNWLDHRHDMRALGIIDGFQWIDGSFVEDKVPGDIDVVTYFHRPRTARLSDAIGRLMRANPDVFQRQSVKQKFEIDGFFVDLDGTKKVLVDLTRYYTGLFSHRRLDGVWKGMVQVDLSADHDDDAREWLLQNAPNGEGEA